MAIKKTELIDEVIKKHFRVSIFGSARIKEKDDIYQNVYDLAYKIGKHNFDLVTGGGPGLMKAANAGHQQGKSKGDAHSVGLTIELPWEAKANKYLDIRKHFDKFSDRLDQFMILSNIVIVMPGGIGTCLELFYSWQLTQVKHICSMPIVLVGEMWEKLIDWVKEQILANDRMSEKDMINIYVVKNVNEAMEIVCKAYEVFEKEGDNYCLNYKKYKLY